MATKYYLNQSGLNQFLETISDSQTSSADVSDNIVVIANPGSFLSKNKKIATIELNTYIEQEKLENNEINFILTDTINNIVKTYHFCGNIITYDALQNVNAVLNNVYKIQDTNLYAVWTGLSWDEFGIIDNFNNAILDTNNFQAISNTALNKVLYNYKPIIVNDVDELIAAINNDQNEMTISVNNDLILSSVLVIPEKKEITLNLNGYNLTSDNMMFNISNTKMTILNGSIESLVNDTILVSNKGNLILNDVDLISHRNGIAVKNKSTVVFNSGSITSTEAGILGLKDSTIIVNGGTITGLDNGPIMGNGSPAGSANDGTNCNIIMNDGTLIAHIQTAGYIACGAYIPNSGSFTMNGGTIISDGCGICIRGGQINLNGGSIVAAGESGVKGKVGDSPTAVGPYAVIYDARSSYPAMDTLELNIASGMSLSGTDGDINYILEIGVEPNVNDNR